MKFFGANFSALTLLTPSVSSSTAHFLYYDIAVPPTVIACTWKLMCINGVWKVCQSKYFDTLIIFIACLLCYRVQTITCKKIMKILRLHIPDLNVYLLRLKLKMKR